MIEFPTGETTGSGYLALPASGSGQSVLVLHAWWGLNDFFRRLCDRLAAAGFVALAPDAYGGQVAATISEAERLVKALTDAEYRAVVGGGIAALRAHPAVRGERIALLGCSLGAAGALDWSVRLPEAVAAVVTFYGSRSDLDFTGARAAYLGHFAEHDEWEPEEEVRATEEHLTAAGRPVAFHRYPGTGHWFFEDDRPDAYDPAAAALAWERTLAFLRERVG